jgi:dTDP-4-amino-4,6-dideoxygalactose transaminase
VPRSGMTAGLPFLDLRSAWSELEAELSEAWQRVAERGHYVLGEEVDAFEAEFAAAVGVQHCVGVGNGFDALQLCLRAWSIGPGDEVVVPAFTFAATWTAVSITGAAPVGVDVDPETYLIDPDLLEAAISARTRAIVPVHLYGHPAAMERIVEIAARHDLPVLEDAAQAHGARRNGAPAGSLGDAAAFSFYPTKNLGALGDGGAVVTDDPDLAETLRVMRNYGASAGDSPQAIGINSRLDEVQAATLRVKLAHLDRWNARRRLLADRYLESLESIPGLDLPRVDDATEPSWHLFVVAHDERDRLRKELSERGIATLVHYPEPPYRLAALTGETEAFPNAERHVRRVLSLPLHPYLSEQSQDDVIGALRQAA